MLVTTMKLDVWHFDESERALLTKGLQLLATGRMTGPDAPEVDSARQLLLELGWDS